MNIYNNFAEVYDLFMEDTPYDEWIEYIINIWGLNNLNPDIVAELGCGTGNITSRLSRKGFEMIGIDNSEPMLMKAYEKNTDKNKILYLNQDMRNFELYGTVDSIISVCDSINYILDSNELLKVFKLVNNYLNPKGLFIFDINTIYKFEKILSSNSYCFTNEDAAYTWENYYDKEERINEFYTNFFIKDKNSELYQRFEEIHYEKGYDISEIIGLIEESGLKFIDVYEEMTFNKPSLSSERIFFIAEENGK